MNNISEWYAAIRGNLVSVVAALAAVGTVFGLDLKPAEQTGLVHGADAFVAGAVALVAAVNVVVHKAKESVKRDPDIDTGPTTPGPVSGS